MKTISELKIQAKSQIKGKIGMLFAMYLLFIICICVASAIPVIGVIVNLISSSVFSLGLAFVFIKVVKDEKLEFGDIFYAFNDLWTAIKANFFVSLFLCLWSLLLVIPGIIKGFSYSLTYYILAENKGMPVLEAITLSRKMMDGHKMDLFLLFLSFIGWFILGAITVGIAYIWIIPYAVATYANFYQSVKEEFNSRI